MHQPNVPINGFYPLFFSKFLDKAEDCFKRKNQLELQIKEASTLLEKNKEYCILKDL